MSLYCLRNGTPRYSMAVAGTAGAAAGAFMIPLVGAVPGFTIGALIGWGLGRKTLKDMEEKLIDKAKEKHRED